MLVLDVVFAALKVLFLVAVSIIKWLAFPALIVTLIIIAVKILKALLSKKL